eukprot:126766-Ditylum_brightwellii.AAC.1
MIAMRNLARSLPRQMKKSTEDKDEYEQLLQAGKKHVIFTDRSHVKHMKAIKGTQKLFQVQGVKKA